MTLQSSVAKITPYPVVQLGWAVPDLKVAVDQWTSLMGAGPFFTEPHIPLGDVEYRGAPSSFDHSMAIGWWGSVEVELMQQHCATPSHIRDMFPDGGYGFGSVSWFAPDLESETRRLEALGFPLCWRCSMADGAFSALWFDARPLLGAMVEVFPEHPAMRRTFRQCAKAAEGWNGERPLRPLSEMLAIEVD